MSEELARSAELRSLALGAEPSWDPQQWEPIVASSRNLREQLRRARAKGVSVRQLEPEELAADSHMRRELLELGDRWLAGRTMAPMGFLVRLDLFGHAQERLYFVAEREGKLLGALVAVPIYAERGWLIEDLLRDDRSPNGTAELLIDAAMRHVAGEGSSRVSMGMAPLAGEVGRLLGAVRALTGWLYHFEGVRAFKEKLGPKSWQPLVVAFPPSCGPLRVIIDTLSAFSDGGLLSFGLSTLRRKRRLAAGLLGALWLLLAAALPFVDGRWFPSPTWRGGWLVGVAGTSLTALALSHRWRRGLAVALTSLLALQTIAAIAQLLTLGSSLAGWSDYLLLTAGMVGPAAAALLVAHAALVENRRPLPN